MNKNICVWLSAVLAVTLSVFSGCGSTITHDKTQYVLNPVRRAEPAPASDDAILEVRRFMMDSAFHGKKLVYRTGEVAYEEDFYHEFLAPPASMIREATRNWLTQSNLFARVVDAAGYVEPTYALEANITTLYGDARDADAPRAVVELRAFLLRVDGARDAEIVHTGVYSVTCEAAAADPNGIVTGYNDCLEAILTDLEKDIAAKL